MSFSSTDEYQKFETLFKQYYSGLVVYASRFTGNTENAEDFVHDLFTTFGKTTEFWERII